MLYHIIAISLSIVAILLILVEGTLILKSLKYLKDIANTSEDFVNVFNAAKTDGALLFEKIKKLSDSTEKKENHMLHTTFHLDEVEMYVKIILEKLKQLNNP